MNRREIIKTMFAGTALAALPSGLQEVCAGIVEKTTAPYMGDWVHIEVVRTGELTHTFINGRLANSKTNPVDITVQDEFMKIASKENIEDIAGVELSGDFSISTYARVDYTDGALANTDDTTLTFEELTGRS